MFKNFNQQEEYFYLMKPLEDFPMYWILSSLLDFNAVLSLLLLFGGKTRERWKVIVFLLMQMHLCFMCTLTTYIFKLLSAAEKITTSWHVAGIITNELTLAKLNIYKPVISAWGRLVYSIRNMVLLSIDRCRSYEGADKLTAVFFIHWYFINFFSTFHVSFQISLHKITTWLW